MYLLSPGKKIKQHTDTFVSILLFCHVHLLLKTLLVIFNMYGGYKINYIMNFPVL